MAGTRQLAPLLDAAARHGAKVVLVGDPKQLPEIHAGGLLAELERQLPTVRLATNRRQTDGTEVHALDRLRVGDPTAALDTFVDADRTIGPNAEAVRERMVADWWGHLKAGADARMLAPRWADADDLNRRARRFMREAGQLRGEPIVVDERPFQVGDQILCLRNDYPHGLRNGMAGTIESIDHEHRRITMATDDGRRTIPTEYIDQGLLRHGYAVTVHKAQGSTCDHSLLLGSSVRPPCLLVSTGSGSGSSTSKLGCSALGALGSVLAAPGPAEDDDDDDDADDADDDDDDDDGGGGGGGEAGCCAAPSPGASDKSAAVAAVTRARARPSRRERSVLTTDLTTDLRCGGTERRRRRRARARARRGTHPTAGCRRPRAPA